MNREEIEELERAAEQNSEILENARKTVAEEKGKSTDSGTEELDEDVFRDYIKKHSREGDYEYLVRGAKLVCNCGSHKRMLNLPECHGVYIGENPMVHENDCVQGINRQGNISWFGICRSERSQELPGKKVCYELTEENSADGTVGETEPGKKCQPVIVGVWQDVYEKTKIVDYWEEVEEEGAEKEDAEEEGAEKEDVEKEDAESEERLCTLTTGSFLVCNYGGIIQPVTSGQEYEMQEKDLGDNRDADGNDINPKLWNEIEETRKTGYGECENENCPLAHERHLDGDETDHGNIHGTNYFTVVFQYDNKTIINEQHVKKGESAEIPTELEEREGYIFTGWDKEVNNVLEDTVVTAVYEKDWIGAIDDIEKIKGFQEEQVYTIKYVAKVLLREGYKVNFVCGVLGNIRGEGAQAGYFESSKYTKNPEPMYLRHMDKYHQYRPGSKYEEIKWVDAEQVSAKHIYELEAGTGIFSKQLCWDSTNNKFLCNDFENHKFGLGICQWTEPGYDPGNNSEQIQEKDLGRLPKLIKRYLDKFGEDAHPNIDECLELETAYLLEEFNDYSSIAGIDKSDCTLEAATEDFLKIFERPKNWESALPIRTNYAKAVLKAFEGVGINGQEVTN